MIQAQADHNKEYDLILPGLSVKKMVVDIRF